MVGKGCYRAVAAPAPWQRDAKRSRRAVPVSTELWAGSVCSRLTFTFGPPQSPSKAFSGCAACSKAPNSLQLGITLAVSDCPLGFLW